MTLRAEEEELVWLRRFHAGDRGVLEACYRDCFAKVAAAASRVLGTVDAETVTHDVFYRLLSDARMREGFRGGDVGAWLARIASNAAIDVARRQRREAPAQDEVDPARRDEEIEAKMTIDRFKERLPEKWLPLFDARFLRHLSQREAAKELGMQRTTLVYQEQKIRELLEDYLLGEDAQ